MANIPQAAPTPDVETRPVPTPYDENRASPETFGEGVAQDVQQEGAIASHISTVARIKANEIAVQGAEAAARAALNQHILDPRTGFIGKHGEEAMQTRDEYLGRFNKDVDSIASGLANEDQRRMFKAQEMSIRGQAAHQSFTHERGEIHQFAAAQTRGNLDEGMKALNNIIAAPAAGMDPEALGAAIKSQVDAIWNTGINDARTRFGADPNTAAGRAVIASVVYPELQKAAVGGMQTALETQDPDIAKIALDQLGKHMLTGHHRLYSKSIEALGARRFVTQQADAILNSSTDAVYVPGSMDPIGRPNATKVATALAALPADAAHRGDIEKAVETRLRGLDGVWDKTAATIHQRVYSAGQDALTGAFDIDSPNIDPADKVWLNEYAPKLLTDLRNQDAKVQRAASLEERREARDASETNLSSVQHWLAQDENRDAILGMTRAQFGLGLRNQDLYPGGFLDPHRSKALAEFDKAYKNAVGKLDDKVGTTVKEAIAEAFPESKFEQDEFSKKFFGHLKDKANDYVKEHKGAVDTKDLRKFVESELVEGHIKGTGRIFENALIEARMRRIEAQMAPDLKGKRFAAPGEPEEILGGNPAAPAPAPQAAPTPAPALPRVTNAADYAALPSGTTFVDPAGKTRRKP